MALKPAYDLRPLGVGEILDYGFRLYQRLFPIVMPPTILLIGIPMIPLMFISTLLQSYANLEQSHPGAVSGLSSWADFTRLLLEYEGLDLTWSAGYGEAEGATALFIFGVYLLFNGILSILGMVIVMGQTARKILGLEVSGESMRELVRRFGLRIVGLTFLQGLVLLVPLVPFMVLLAIGAATLSTELILIGALTAFPGLLIYMYLAMAMYCSDPALIVEDLRPIPALVRSFQLTRGHWWRIFIVVLVLSIVTQLVMSLTVGLTSFLLVLLLPRWELLITTALNIISATFLSPLSAIIYVLIYFDIRIRREQFDIEYYMLQNAEDAAVATSSGTELEFQPLG